MQKELQSSPAASPACKAQKEHVSVVQREPQKELNRRHSDSQKENSHANHIVNDQKRLLSELERRLQREGVAASIPTPTEFMKICKRVDVDGIMQDNSQLRTEVNGLQTELE